MYTDDTDAYAFARPYITAGESILWRGKPETGNLITSQDVFMIPFSIFWLGFAVFWTVAAASSAGFFGLFGVPFICVGLYLVFGRFLWTAYIRKRTAYVITTRKIIRQRGSRIDMLDGKTMPSVHVTAYKNGCGTIRFGQLHPYYRGSYNSMDPNHGLFALENIAEVARVQEYLYRMER